MAGTPLSPDRGSGIRAACSARSARRPAAGFGWFDPATAEAAGAFALVLLDASARATGGGGTGDSAGMVDLQPEEKAALRAAMKPVAEIMEEIGWERRLCRPRPERRC